MHGTPGVDPATCYDVVVVGGGHAGTQLVTELINAGFGGRIALIEAGDRPPYERPPLSKGVLLGEVGVDELGLRSAAFWANPGLDLVVGEAVVAVDPVDRVVTTDAGVERRYGQLVWAAGGRPRALPFDGAGLAGVHRLAAAEDAVRLRAAIEAGGGFVIVGGGFIGLEVAAAAAQGGAPTRILEREDRLLARAVGPEVSAHFHRRHTEAGVEVTLGARVVGLTPGEDGSVAGVELDSGEWVAATQVLVAIGLIPNVGPLAEAGAQLGDGVEVDGSGRTSLPDVYAVGDCASSLLDGHGRRRIESIDNAVDQSKIVAASIVGRGPAESRPPPRFWSNQYATSYKAVGVVRGGDERICRGDPLSDRFSVVHVRDGVIAAVECVNTTKDYALARRVIGARVRPDVVADPSCRLTDVVGPMA